MTVDLLFRDALGPQPGGDVRLVFGGTGSAPPDPPTYPDPSPGLLRAAWGLPWRRGVPLAPAVAAAPWGKAQAVAAVPCAVPWGRSDRVGQHLATPWGRTAAAVASVSTPWSTTAVRSAAVRLPWAQTVRAGTGLVLPWRTALQRSGAVGLPWRAGLPFVGRVLAPWHRGQGASVRVIGSAQAGRPAVSLVQAPWQLGRQVESIGGPWTPDPLVPVPPVPCYLPDPGNDVLLLLRESLPALPLRLLFSCHRSSLVVVPIRRVYYVINDVTLQLLDGTPIPQLGLTLSLDVDSWCWRFSARLPGSAMSLLNPDSGATGVELLASINGQSWRLVAEPMGRDRTLGRSEFRLQGRGRTALLAAPYAAVATFNNLAGPLTSQQLIDQALPSGWTCDYGQVPWLVPAGAWSHRGTPLTAAMAVATAAGGYLQPHANAPVLRVLPRYPAAPWHWSTLSPDIELPGAVTRREGIEWSSKPVYNRVYVAGAAAGGKLVRVTRAGTAGDLAADTVTEALATHVDAGRQRGLAILSDTGAQAVVSLSLQVLPEAGVITPGKLVRYVDAGVVRLGLVRSVSVEAGFPAVWQTIGIETHVG